MDSNTAYQELVTIWRETATLGSIGSIISWDQECLLPDAGGSHRAEQQALLAGIVHERRTTPRIGELIDACADLTTDEQVNVDHIQKSYDRATRLPQQLVTELSKQRSLCYQAWKDAREADDFAAYSGALSTMLDLVKQSAACLQDDSHEDHYAVLLDQYEPGASTSHIATLFSNLAKPLSEMVQAWRTDTPDSFPQAHYPIPAQQELCQRVLAVLGFNFQRGRLDTAVHPFCTGLGPDDIRLTTRFKEHDPLEALSSAMHEGGHGIYEQGLNTDHWGLPMGKAVSLGIHESQSRLYENQIGRSLGFNTWLMPLLHATFPETQALDAAQLTKLQNQVAPGFIRVDADEVTYNLHIILRFEIEQQLLNNEISVDELPHAWNQRFKELFDLEVPNNQMGCLQDIHWAHGAFGYFPTYTLGNCYAAQFYQQAQQEINNLENKISQGDFKELQQWLGAKVHQHGHRHQPESLCESITGTGLQAEPLLKHLRERYEAT